MVGRQRSLVVELGGQGPAAPPLPGRLETEAPAAFVSAPVVTVNVALWAAWLLVGSIVPLLVNPWATVRLAPPREDPSTWKFDPDSVVNGTLMAPVERARS